jgi:hypothetical protein
VKYAKRAEISLTDYMSVEFRDYRPVDFKTADQKLRQIRLCFADAEEVARQRAVRGPIEQPPWHRFQV